MATSTLVKNAIAIKYQVGMDAIIVNNAFYSTGAYLVLNVKADIVDTNSSNFQLTQLLRDVL